MSTHRGQKLLEALDELEQELRRAKRRNEAVSLVLLDVDALDAYAEANGRRAEKKVMSTVWRLAVRACRETDLVTRLGQEDLGIVLSGASKEDASEVAERLRQLVAEHEFPGEEKLPSGRLTASFGIASYPTDAGSATDLAGSADRALYLAKVNGKNCVRLYDDNKRSRRRKEIALAGDFSTLELRHEHLRTIDVSTVGLRFAAECELPVGVLIDIRLRVPEADHEIEMAARVLRSKEIRPPSSGWFSGRFQTIGGSYEIAARTIEISSRDSRALSQHLWGSNALD